MERIPLLDLLLTEAIYGPMGLITYYDAGLTLIRFCGVRTDPGQIKMV